jgi:glutamate-ammonia-ligase adenylyltransferase
MAPPERLTTVKPRPPEDLPVSLAGRWEQVAARLAELPEGVLRDSSDFESTVGRVAVCSDFVLTILLRHTEELLQRLEDPEPLSVPFLSSRFALAGCNEAQAMRILRQTRNVEMARVAWRDIACWSGIGRNLSELSLLADCAIRAAADFAADELEPRYGRPRTPDGGTLPLLILGMGKLGGRELNYSSDVDLVLLYPEEAMREDGLKVDVQGYYRRFGQLVIKLLDQSTQDGFVYRVDTRLRPFGESGPLVVSVPALESYLLQHGRDWERYAYVKARLLTGEEFETELFNEIITPFVYRRYLDYGVFAALRQMKALIAQEVVRREMAENIKLGPGGIREIEFIVQVYQLLRGGQIPALRNRALLNSLACLVENGYLGADAATGLADAYRFLRTLENRMQAMNDQQLHDLPEDPAVREQLAFSMGAASWPELYGRVTEHREVVEREFTRVALDRRSRASEEGTLEAWEAAWERGDLADVLETVGVEEPEEIGRQLEVLRNGPLYARMDEVSRQRLSAAVSRLVALLTQTARPAHTLERVLPVLEAVGRRSAYLALLNENPAALERLLRIAGESEFLVRQVTEHPLLLDELLDARVFEKPPSRAELESMLERTLGSSSLEDVESRLEAMRQFQRAALFRIAVSDRLGSLPLMKVSDRLTDTAELILGLALDTAWSELVRSYGTPRCGESAERRDAGFAIIGYGKLGGLELSYGSDLDLVFLHDSAGPRQETDGRSALDNARFFVRLAQRLIHYLSTQTRFGRLYEIDTRLRPSGQAGFLVASMDSFRKYQRDDAWVWEHQALLRSRAVAGAEGACREFEEERRRVLVHHVRRADLKAEVSGMRERMRAELSTSGPEEFDIKQDPGGLADIEFLIDYWVLSNSSEHPELVEFPDNVRQLESLERAQLISAEEGGRLKAIYLRLRERVHELALNEGGRVIDAEEFGPERDWVRARWDAVFAG